MATSSALRSALLCALSLVPLCSTSLALPTHVMQRGGSLLADRAAWGVLRLTGPDARRFLHQQSTNAFEGLSTGAVREAVITTSTGRMRDFICAATTAPEEILLLCSPGRAATLAAEMDMFIFPADKVEVADASADFCVFSLLGAATADTLSHAKLGTAPPSGGCVALDADAGWAFSGTGLAAPGVTLLAHADRSAEVRTALEAVEGVELGAEIDYDLLSVLHGRPRAGFEISKEYNPLEAGLQRAISFNKGCYIGQETIAKLATYDGVKQRLCGLRLSAPLPPLTKLFLAGGGDAAGDVAGGEVAARAPATLTGCLETAEGVFGLGYVRCRAEFELSEGLKLRTADGEVEAAVYEVPLAPLAPVLELGKDGPAAGDEAELPVSISV